MSKRTLGWVLIVLGVVASLRFVIDLVDQPAGFGGIEIAIAPIDILGVVLVLVGLKLRMDADDSTLPPPPGPPQPPRSDAADPRS